MTGVLTIRNESGRDVIHSPQGTVALADLLSWEGLVELLESMPQADTPVEHTFSGGVYVRQMFIPAGTLIVGKRHRHETCNILLRGELSVYLGDGKPVTHVCGPLIMTSEPMTRKIAYCHQDTVFLNIHPTTETDLDKIEKQFIITEPEYRAYLLEQERNTPCLGDM